MNHEEKLVHHYTDFRLLEKAHDYRHQTFCWKSEQVHFSQSKPSPLEEVEYIIALKNKNNKESQLRDSLQSGMLYLGAFPVLSQASQQSRQLVVSQWTPSLKGGCPLAISSAISSAVWVFRKALPVWGFLFSGISSILLFFVDSSNPVESVNGGQRGSVAPSYMDTARVVNVHHLAGHARRHLTVRVAHFDEFDFAAGRILFTQVFQYFGADMENHHGSTSFLQG
nr:MAG TPA: hypothetical protein [Caudoviricetes sp.]